MPLVITNEQFDEALAVLQEAISYASEWDSVLSVLSVPESLTDDNTVR